jgi:hypothetical protein
MEYLNKVKVDISFIEKEYGGKDEFIDQKLRT